jgi:DNA polymerase III psi subunit
MLWLNTTLLGKWKNHLKNLTFMEQIEGVMTNIAIRKKLMTYLADADDKKVKAIYTLFEDEINQEESFKLTEEHVKILDERRVRHLNGKDKSSSWQEVHDRVRRKRKS